MGTGGSKTGRRATLSASVQLNTLQYGLRSHYRKHYRYLSCPVGWSADYDNTNKKLQMGLHYVDLFCSRLSERDGNSYIRKPEAFSLSEVVSSMFPTCSASPGSLSSGRHVLLVGEAGGGKSTVCKKLAWDWSFGRQPLQGAYTVLVVVCVGDLRDGEHIAGYIHRMLSDEENSVMSVKDIEKIVCEQKEKVLLILDGIDECSKGLSLAKDLIEDKVFGDCAQIITSRRHPDFTRSDIKPFTALSLNHLRYSDVSAFVSKVKKSPTVPELSSNLTELLTVPLLLDLYYSLKLDESNKGKGVTQVEIFETLLTAVVKRYVSMHRNSKVVSSDVHAELCEAAYAALLHDSTTVLQEAELLEECTGLVEKFYGSGSNDCSYRFTHKLIQEYLAAKYIIQCSEKIDAVVEKLMKIPGMKEEIARGSAMLVVFICGMLAKKNVDVIKYLLSVLPDIDSSAYDCAGGHIGHSSHLILQCLSECRKSGLSGNKAMLQNKVPSKILIDLSTCKSSCIVGALSLGKQIESTGEPGLDLFVTVFNCTVPDNGPLRALVTSAGVNQLSLHDNCDVEKLFGAGGIYDNVDVFRLNLCRCSSNLLQQYTKLSPKTLQLSQCTTNDMLDLFRYYGTATDKLILDDIQICHAEGTQLLKQLNSLSCKVKDLQLYECRLVEENSPSSSRTIKYRPSRLLLDSCSSSFILWLLSCCHVSDLLAVRHVSCTESLWLQLLSALDGSYVEKLHLVGVNIAGPKKCMKPSSSVSERRITLSMVHLSHCDFNVITQLLSQCVISALVSIEDTTCTQHDIRDVITALGGCLVQRVQLLKVQLTGKVTRSNKLPALHTSVVCLDRCNPQLCVDLLNASNENVKDVILKQIHVNDGDIDAILATLEKCSKLEYISIQGLSAKQPGFMYKLSQSAVISKLPTIAIDCSCLQEVEASSQLIRAACRLEELYMYCSCNNSEIRASRRPNDAGGGDIESALCRVLCTAGSAVPCVYMYGVSGVCMYETVLSLSDEEKKAVRWKELEMNNLKEERIDGNWEQKIGEVLKNQKNKSQASE